MSENNHLEWCNFHNFKRESLICMLLQGPFSLHQISERQGKERKKEKVERETAMWSS